MNIEMIPVSEIIPYEENPRKNESAVEAVAESIKTFGFRVPVIIDVNGIIIAGHTRFKAARVLGLENIPCIRAENLTPEQVKALRLIDNKTQELSDWDYSKVMEELEKVENIDMRIFGFSEFVDAIPEKKLEKDIDAGSEIDIDSFEDESFAFECPCCGFRFNE